jgi:hypothetical protein
MIEKIHIITFPFEITTTKWLNDNTLLILCRITWRANRYGATGPG